MARDESFPFDFNEWYVDGGARPDLEGKEIEVDDLDYSTPGVNGTRSGRRRRMRCIRNVSAAVALPKRVVRSYLFTGVEALGQTDGYATDGLTANRLQGVVNEWLPAAGAPINALFFVVVEGPSKVTTAAAGDTNISVGAYVKASTDGKVVDQVVAEDDADIFAEVQGRIGWAINAVNAINTDFLINVQLG